MSESKNQVYIPFQTDLDGQLVMQYKLVGSTPYGAYPAVTPLSPFKCFYPDVWAGVSATLTYPLWCNGKNNKRTHNGVGIGINYAHM